MTSTSLLIPGDLLSLSELCSAALDGELAPLGHGYVPIDAPVTAQTRAAALASAVLDGRVIVSDRSAAWVWGWAPAPTAVTTCVAITARIPSPDRRRLRAREVVIDDDERQLLGTVSVTTPLRTLLDLARHDGGPDVISLLAAGIRCHGIGGDDLEAGLARRPSVSYVRPARARLTSALAAAATARDA